MFGIGALNFNIKGFAAFGKGTAFLISPDLAVTSAHNIFDQETRKVSTNIKFYPGVNGELKD